MVRGPLAAVVCTALAFHASAAAGATLPLVVPAPLRAAAVSCAAGGLRLARPLRFPASVDPGGFALVRERWTALGIAPPIRSAHPDVAIASPREPARDAGSAERYELTVGARRVTIRRRTAEGEFDALVTLAQLARGRGRRALLPCVRIDDAPAMRLRVISDDVSRGPFPTARYVRQRLRTLASLKINGWSPYMEQVVADPLHPYVATPNRWTPADLRAIARYARRFHIRLIPEQQTFAHMHESLKYESLGSLAELPHGWLMRPGPAAAYAYLEPLLRAELRATQPAFMHIGADEPLDLGEGPTPRTPEVYAAHVNRLAAVVEAFGARPMIWDDAALQTPAILDRLDRRLVIVSFHYGAERSYRRYLAPLAAHGFTTLVSPGAANWNELYPDLTTAYANIGGFVRDGQAGGCAGMFATVWHDDGETLYEATWPAVAFAAASAWQRAPVARATWHAAFARALFGSDDARYVRDLDALEAMRDALRTEPDGDQSDYVFWHDPFDARLLSRTARLDVRGIRLHAESIITDLATAHPALHATALDAMRLAAWRYDVLGRRLEIGREAQDDYAAARRAAASHDDRRVYRNLNLAKYLCWELRDEMTALAPRYARAWRAESTPPGLARVLVRFAMAAADAQRDADRIDAVEREDYLRGGSVPPFDAAIEARP